MCAVLASSSQLGRSLSSGAIFCDTLPCTHVLCACLSWFPLVSSWALYNSRAIQVSSLCIQLWTYCVHIHIHSYINIHTYMLMLYIYICICECSHVMQVAKTVCMCVFAAAWLKFSSLVLPTKSVGFQDCPVERFSSTNESRPQCVDRFPKPTRGFQQPSIEE